MMKPVYATVLISVGLIVAGCAGFGARDAAGGRGGELAVLPDEGAVLAALPDSALPKGTCGMVLWTLDEQRPIPVFRYIVGKSGEVVINGETLALRRVEASGASAYGVFEDQSFNADTGVTISVDVRLSLGFDGGSYLERGLIKVESDDGWRTVVPSAGLAGCRAK